MADTVESFVRAGSFRESWRDRFQNKWPAMTTMMMRSESEIDYPNITPCPDFGIKNPSIRSWGSNPDTWTADSPGGEVTDEESSSRVTKGDKRSEKICRAVLCIFLILSVLAAAFAGIGLSILLTQPEFGVTGKTSNDKDFYIDARLDESEQRSLTDTFCDVVFKMLNGSGFPIERGIHSCETVLKYTKGLEGLHIEIDVKPTDGYTLKEKFIRSLRELAAQRKEETDTKANDNDIQRNIFANTGLIFPKTGGFIEFLPDISQTSLVNDSDNVASDVTTTPKHMNNSSNTTQSHQIDGNFANTTNGTVKENTQESTSELDKMVDKAGPNLKHDSQGVTLIADKNVDKTGNDEQIITANKPLSITTNDSQEIKVGFTDIHVLSHPVDVVEDSSSTVRSIDKTTSTVNKALVSESENSFENASIPILPTISSNLNGDIFSSKYTSPFETTQTVGITSSENISLNTSTNEFEKETKTTILDDNLNLSSSTNTVNDLYTSPFRTTQAANTTPSTTIPRNSTIAEFENETKTTTVNDIPSLSSSIDTVDDPNISTSTLITITTENDESTRSNTKDVNRAVTIKSVKLFEVNNMGNSSGVVLNTSKTGTKGQRDIVAESLMSGGFMRLPMKTTSNFKFLFSSGNNKNKISNKDDTSAASTVVVKRRTKI